MIYLHPLEVEYILERWYEWQELVKLPIKSSEWQRLVKLPFQGRTIYVLII